MQFTNQLIHSQSPYLLQHSHNPVDWFPWCNEALQKSIDENKPILVSIGYSSCHWCHVMERESFEDETTAAIMNQNFINIKIDREERPDLDHIYMDAVQAMTGSGGWPLNVFLTPQLKPFFGGTYFPPVNAHGRMSWKDTLLAVSKAFIERNDDIENQATKLTEHLISSNSFKALKNKSNEEINVEMLQQIASNVLAQGDVVWGGFGNAPKFPQTGCIQYLLRQYHFTKDEECLNQALLSLDKMIQGGIYDQVGGGFSRYSTDEKWFAPHFEKMLYDNALIVGVLCEAYQITKKKIYADVIHQTLDFVEKELMNTEFAFYSALDADSEGIEGKFYTWGKAEIEKLLGEDASIFCEIYNVKDEGNWEHDNILWLKKTVEEYAKSNKLDVGELDKKIKHCKETLLIERNKRIRPQLDDKIITSWNAMMNVAYSKAFAATGFERYKHIAISNMSFLLNDIFCNENLMHCYKNNKAYISAFLDDYAYLIYALIHLQEITGNQNYIVNAKQLCDQVMQKFADNESFFFFFTEQNQENTIVRKIEIYDGAVPSANSIMAFCINYLSGVFFDDNLRKRFLDMSTALSSAILKHPTSFSYWASSLQSVVYTCKEIVAVGEAANTAIATILSKYIPNKIFLSANNEASCFLPILKGKWVENETNYFICQGQSCLPPAKELYKFLHLYNI
ncbi:MAG: thioredoxin domain-containing protein [Chitinophagaceae bacterium]